MNGQCSCGYRPGRISSIDCRCVTHRELNERLRKIDPNEGYYQKEIDELKDTKQDKLIAGQNITIEGSLISADLDSTNFYTKTETDELLAEKQGTLTAGENIVISEDNVISADAHMLVTLTPTGAPVGGVTDYTWTSEHTYAELVAGLDKVAFKTTEAGSENILVPTELYEALESGQNVIFGMVPSNDAVVPKITNIELIVRPNGTAKTTEVTALIEDTNTNVYGFDTVADMKASTELKAGDFAKTVGFYAKDDGGGSYYKIEPMGAVPPDDTTIFDLSSGGLVAVLVATSEMNIAQFGLVGDGITDESPKLNIAFGYNGDSYLKLNFCHNRTYLAQNEVYLYSNTEINLNGATIKSCHDTSDTAYIEFGNGLRFLNNPASIELNGYGAIQNVKVYGGIFDGGGSGVLFGILHGMNINFHDVMFKDCCVGTHIFDLGGCKDVTIKNCDFNGYLISNPNNNYREMIQMDYAAISSMPYWGYSRPEFDKLPTVDLTIDGCEFSKGDGEYYPSAIGSHSGNVSFHEHIIVRNCKFNGTSTFCIRIPRARYVLIDNNEIDCEGGEGVRCQNYYNSSATEQNSEHITISNNVFKSKGNYDSAIRLQGVYANGQRYNIRNVLIKDNDFSNKEAASAGITSIAINISNAERISIVDNIFTGYKHVCLKDNNSIFKESSFSGNMLKDCVSFINATSSDDVDILAQCVNIEQIDNVWSDSNGVFNINNFRLMLSCSSSLTADSSSQKYYMCPLDTKSENIGDFVTGSQYVYQLPACINKVKVTGVVSVACGSSTNHKIFRLNTNANGTFTEETAVKKTFAANQQDSSTMECTIGDDNLKRTGTRIQLGFDAYLEQGDKIDNEFGSSKLTYLIIEGI